MVIPMFKWRLNKVAAILFVFALATAYKTQGLRKHRHYWNICVCGISELRVVAKV